MKLKEYRKAAKMTQTELASAVGVTRLTIARYECGTRKPPAEIAERISEILHIPSERMWDTFYATDTQVLLSP